MNFPAPRLSLSFLTAQLRLMAIASLAMATLTSPAQSPALTITNPTPTIFDAFGYSVATVGNTVLVGDPQHSTTAQSTGAAYLFSSNGVLMRTFLNPALANGFYFGLSVASVGNDKVLIGAPRGSMPVSTHSGAAYLYHTNGALIRTFLRPIAQAGAGFGFAVAAVGADRVVIGAPGDDRAGTDAGAAYLFSTNGTLLATFTNSAPSNSEYFGQALTAVGSDRVLIGGPGNIFYPGSALLFNINGTLLTRFNHPSPQSEGSFGYALAALGTDKMAIAAPFANVMAPRGGVVYLFTTNGFLLPALLNPDATEEDNFGVSLAAIGADKLLIGSLNQAEGQNIGAAYLFSTNDTVLMKIRNPSTNSALFGTALAAVGTNRAVIGAREADPAGAAYVFDLRPSLNISKTATNTVVVLWPSPWTDWSLQYSADLNAPNWVASPESVTDDGTNKFILKDPSGSQRYYRLAAP